MNNSNNKTNESIIRKRQSQASKSQAIKSLETIEAVVKSVSINPLATRARVQILLDDHIENRVAKGVSKQRALYDIYTTDSFGKRCIVLIDELTEEALAAERTARISLNGIGS